MGRKEISGVQEHGYQVLPRPLHVVDRERLESQDVSAQLSSSCNATNGTGLNSEPRALSTQDGCLSNRPFRNEPDQQLVPRMCLISSALFKRRQVAVCKEFAAGTPELDGQLGTGMLRSLSAQMLCFYGRR